MQEHYTFDCGCTFPIIGPPTYEGGLPRMQVNPNEVPLCSRVWDLLATGRTVGIFQLEKAGRQWAKKLKPESEEHMGALGAILRPGAAEAKDEHGVSMTENYCLVKNGEKILPTYTPEVDEVLKATNGQLIYQESAMRLASEVAGFTDSEADSLRKACGKKLPEEMAKVKTLFLEGCKKTGRLTEEQAKEVFGWIEKSQRYSFNKCLDPNTVVHGAFGEKKLSEVRIGDYIEDESQKLTKVLGVYNNGPKNLYEFELSNGLIVRCSLDHKFASRRKYGGEEYFSVIPISKIEKNNYLIVCRKGDHLDSASIVRRKFLGKKDTIDIEVSNASHLFMVNGGILTSNSHAMSYGKLGYIDAYQKSHFPLNFFKSHLQQAEDYDEVEELVEDAKLFDVTICPPDFRQFSKDFKIKQGKVYFGLSNIRGIGEKLGEKLCEQFGKDKEHDEWTWKKFLCEVASVASKTAVVGVISAGGMDWTGMSRTRMLNEAATIHKDSLSGKEEISTLVAKKDEWNTLSEGLELIAKMRKDGGGCSTKGRIAKVLDLKKLLDNPPSSEVDSLSWLAAVEKNFLGASITCSNVDACDLTQVNCSVKELVNGFESHCIILGVEIVNARDYTVKKGKSEGKKMCYLTIKDNSAMSSDITVFADVYGKEAGKLFNGNLVLLKGERDKKKGGFIVKAVYQL